MRALKLLTGRRVIITTELTSVGGIVDSATRDVVTLRDAVSLDGTTPVPLDGVVLVPAGRIAHVQVP